MSEPIGIFGLGLIGMALAERLMAGGHAILGSDPDVERTSLLTDLGGQAAAPAEIWGCKTVLVAVFDTDQLADLVQRAQNNAPVQLICFSTCDPQRMSEIAAQGLSRNITLVEAPISGTSKQLASGDAILLIGSDQPVADELTPLFDALSRAHYPVGALGNGNRAKLAINLILGLNRAALAEGLVFAEALGLEPHAFLQLAQQSAAASAVMKTKGPLMVERSFSPQGRISQSKKDFGLIRDAAESQGQGLPFAETYLAMMEDCFAHGESGYDNSAIINALARAKLDKN